VKAGYGKLAIRSTAAYEVVSTSGTGSERRTSTHTMDQHGIIYPLVERVQDLSRLLLFLRDTTHAEQQIDWESVKSEFRAEKTPT
jgi:hypothetical protein